MIAPARTDAMPAKENGYIDVFCAAGRVANTERSRVNARGVSESPES